MFGSNNKLPEVSYDNLRQFSEEEQWNYIIKHADDRLKDSLHPKISQQLFTVWKNHHAELKNHTSQLYPGQITFFQAREKLPKSLDSLLNMNVDEKFVIEAWNQIASEPIERILLPGNHFTVIEEPNVQILAEFLKVVLKKVQADYV